MIPNFKKIRFINDISSMLILVFFAFAALLFDIGTFKESIFLIRASTVITGFSLLLMFWLKAYMFEKLREMHRHELKNEWRDSK